MKGNPSDTTTKKEKRNLLLKENGKEILVAKCRQKEDTVQYYQEMKRNPTDRLVQKETKTLNKKTQSFPAWM